MAKTLYVLACGLLFLIHVKGQPIIPLPQKITTGNKAFVLKKSTTISTGPANATEGLLLQKEIEAMTGFHLSITEKNETGKNSIVFKSGQLLSTGEESYQLDISETGIIIRSSDAKGAFYGCMSLLQLLPVPGDKAGSPENAIPLPAVSITDFPRFKWRGLMLDVSRTFLSPDYIKRTIRRMSFYKLNVLHLHLTDDQGWRIPVKAYPLLTSKAAFFDPSYHEPKEFQGFYTTRDIAELLRFAASYHVEIVPEIESPGHSHAALFAYPDLSCDGNISPIFPFFSGPGISNDVFCVGNPGSLLFFQAVIKETASLFTSSYLHLGGDEVPRTEWEKCPKCQALVRSAKLPNTGALQGYFMQQLHDEAIKEKKRPVAWDEILMDNQSLSKDWVIMSWRGSKPGLDAAEKGYDVVMTPTSNMYFDYSYATTNTKKVFDFDPFDGRPAERLGNHVLGIQANFWSHIDRTESKIDLQLYPRVLGLAERAWSAAEDTSYDQFRTRQLYHKNWLEYMKVRYYAGDFK